MKQVSMLLLLVLAGLYCKAQSAYIPFPDANAIWTERHGNGEAPANIYTYGLKNSDTVLNGVTYHKLYFSADSVLDDNEFWAGLRQDVAAKKVYLYIPGNAEVLLYDFSLQLGDVFHNNLQVSYIDSVMVGGMYRKRFTFTYTGSGVVLNDQWLEGIGNTDLGGPFGYPIQQPTCDCGSSTICVSQNGQWIYHNTQRSTLTCYKPVLGIKDDFPVNSADITVYPNPLTGNGHIRIGTPHLYNTIDIYNATGIKTGSYNITGKTDVAIDGSRYAPGIYFYRAGGDKGNVTTGRLVVE